MRSVAKHSYLKGRLAKTKGIAHTHYIQKRSGKDKDLNDGRPRRFFDAKSNDVDGDLVRQQIAGQKGVVVMHKLILSPGLEPVEMQDYSRELLQEFGDSKGLDLDWYGVVHGNTDHQHAHIVIMGRDKNDKEVRLRKVDYEELRYLGDRYLEKYHTYERFLDRDLEKLLEGGYSRDLGDGYYERLLKDVKSDLSFEELAKERQEEKEKEREEDDEKYKNRKQLEETGELDRLRKQFDDDFKRSLREDRSLEPKKGHKQWLLESKGRLLESHEKYEISMARMRLKNELKNKTGSEENADRLKEIQEELAWLKGLVQEDFETDTKEKEVEVNADLQKEETEREEDELAKLKSQLKETRGDKSDAPAKGDVKDKASEERKESKEDLAAGDRKDSENRDSDKAEEIARDKEIREEKEREDLEKEEAERREIEEQEREEQEERDRQDQEERDRIDQEDRAREVAERDRLDEVKRQEQAAREKAERMFRLQMEAERFRDQQMESERESTATSSRSQLDEKIERYSREIENARDGIDTRESKLDDIKTKDFDLDKDVEQNWELEQKLGDDREIDGLELELNEFDRDEIEEREGDVDLADAQTAEMLGDDVKGLLADYEKLPEEERIAAWEKNAFEPELIQSEREEQGQEHESSEQELTGEQLEQSFEEKSQELDSRNLQEQMAQLQQTIQVELQREFFNSSSRDERSEPESTHDEKDKEEDKGMER